MPLALSPVRLGLADQVVEMLITAVARGDYPPDSQLPPESELAERCEVSRLTLREAITSLRGKGVVRVEQGRGTFVNPQTMWSPLDPALLSARLTGKGATGDLARSLTEARRLVEVGVAELAASRRSSADIHALRAAFERMNRAHLEDDADAFTVADIDFHDAVIEAAGNEVVNALYQPIEALLRMVRYETSSVVQSREAGLLLHAAIADAVASGSPEEARLAMLEHFRHTEEILESEHSNPSPTVVRARRRSPKA